MKTFITLKKEAAEILGLLDSSDAILAGKDITETRIGQSINDAYRSVAFRQLSSQYPHYFEQVAKAANYSVTGTVDATSTSTTLVATTSIFTQSMVGQTVYNSTDSEGATIQEYTSGTTVTISSTIGDTWDGDTIKVVDRDFTMGGDATDEYDIKYVKVRYGISNTDDIYRRAQLRKENDMFMTNTEVFSEGVPMYFITTVSVSGTPTTAIQVRPMMTIPDDVALEIKYIQVPPELSDDADVPRIPGDASFLYWKAVADGAYQRHDFALGDRAIQKFEKGLERMITSFRPSSSDVPLRFNVPRRFGNMMKRNI